MWIPSYMVWGLWFHLSCHWVKVPLAGCAGSSIVTLIGIGHSCYRGTVRSQLELMIGHPVKGCAWPREHRQTDCTCAPHLTRQDGAPWAQMRANYWKEGISWTYAASWDGVLSNPKEHLHQLGEFISSFTVWLLVYLQIFCLPALRTCQMLFHFFVSKTAAWSKRKIA